MTVEFSEKERAFIDGLSEETGCDLAGWMVAIAHSGQANRNDIIDWLRQHGFTFARASWLERIHHNGGRLIYGAAVVTRSQPPRKKAQPVPSTVSTVSDPARLTPVAAVSVAPAPPRTVPNDGDIDTLLQAAKAYRPLAQVVLRELLAAVPGADVTTAQGVIVLSHTRPFAALAPTAKEVRLYLALSEPVATGWLKTKGPARPEGMAALSHVLALTDARQVSADLRTLIAHSASLTAA